MTAPAMEIAPLRRALLQRQLVGHLAEAAAAASELGHTMLSILLLQEALRLRAGAPRGAGLARAVAP